LINSLVASGVSPIIATGSSANTGNSDSATSTIGSADIANLYYSVNEAYRSSPKCCWLVNDTTLGYLASLVTKFGLPLVNWFEGQAFILGKPVRVTPSMPNMSNSAVSVIFGALDYWITNIVTGEQNGFQSQYIQKYTEAPSLVDNGMFGLRAFLRAGGALASNDPGSPSPLNYIIQHS
jgi:HK97 family phage major capsid protein